MAVIRAAGKVKTVLVPVTPSTAFTRDTLVKFASGKVTPSEAGDAAAITFGVIRHTIASTDSDYASDRLIPIEVPVEKHVEYDVDVNSGLVATDLGAEFDIAGAGTVDRAASTDDVFLCIKRFSATKGRFFIRFNGSY